MGTRIEDLRLTNANDKFQRIREIIPGLPECVYEFFEYLGEKYLPDNVDIYCLHNKIHQLLNALLDGTCSTEEIPDSLVSKKDDIFNLVPLFSAVIESVSDKEFAYWFTDRFSQIYGSYKTLKMEKYSQSILGENIENIPKSFQCAAEYLYYFLQTADFHNIIRDHDRKAATIFVNRNFENQATFDIDSIRRIIRELITKKVYYFRSLQIITIASDDIMEVAPDFSKYGKCDSNFFNLENAINDPDYLIWFIKEKHFFDVRIPDIEMQISLNRIVVNRKEIWNTGCGWILPGSGGRGIDPSRRLIKPE